MVAQKEPYEFPAIRAYATELEEWRTQAGMSKAELAELLGYTQQLIGQIEAAKNLPSKKFAEDLDTYFRTNGVFLRLWSLINETRHLAVLPRGFPDSSPAKPKPRPCTSSNPASSPDLPDARVRL